MDNSNIMLSRNSPVALVIGAAGFIGSHVSEELLKAQVQVIGVDNLSTGDKRNLESCIRDKRFHFIHRSISEPLKLNIQRLDYAFFITDSSESNEVFNSGILNFLRFVKFQAEKEEHFANISQEKALKKIRVAFVSSISLYKRDLNPHDGSIKDAEIVFAKFVKESKLNARIIRIAPTFGPRMHFREKDPLFRVLEAYLSDSLLAEETSSDLATRAVFVDDAVSCILKTVFLSSTSHKIFDAVSTKPLRVTQIKQILLDPLWFDSLHIEPEPLPLWPTPNLKRTIKELSWKPTKDFIEGLKDTVVFFKDRGVPEEILEKRGVEQLSAPALKSSVEQKKNIEIDHKEETKKRFKFPNLFLILGLGLILFGMIFPILSLAYGTFSIKTHVSASKEALAKGDFNRAYYEVDSAKKSVSQMQDFLSSLSIVKKVSFLELPVETLEKILKLTEEGVEGIGHSTSGLEALYESTKVMSGEASGDPKEYFEKAQLELSGGSSKLSKVSVALSDKSLTEMIPGFLKSRVEDLSLNLAAYSFLVEKAKVASYLLPSITAVGDKKVYLVLFQNNTELRPTGGFIGSYGRLEFENGKIKNIKVDDIYNLDGNLKDHVEPPPEIKEDLGQKDWFLRDSNFEPDFPTSARQAEFFYNKEAGERVHGVIAMDLTAAGKLIDAVGGLNLPDYQREAVSESLTSSAYNETVTQENLFENALKHSEIDFFPGSSGKRNYLTSLQNALFNKIFFTSNQNWPAIVGSVGETLEEKHMLLYFEDPQIFSYIASQNWAGILPREPEGVEGETQDLLAVVDANLGANKANYYLERTFQLDTVIGKNQEIFHHLQITYKNNSPSSAFPGGIYKNRLRIYLPSGSKLNKMTVNRIDYAKEMNPLSDYGRTYYSTLIEVSPKQEVVLNFDYALLNPLSFKNGVSKYRLDVIKQAGTNSDPFEWSLTYPINLEIESEIEGALTSLQEMDVKSTLSTDRTFLVDFKKL